MRILLQAAILPCGMETGFELDIGGTLYRATVGADGRVRVRPEPRAAQTEVLVRLGPGGGTVAAGQHQELADTFSDKEFWETLGAADADKLSALAGRAAKEAASADPGARTMAGALAIEFAVTAARARAMVSGMRWREPAGVWSLDDVVRCIELNYSRSFSLEFFVGKCASNTSDFSRRFKERAGCPLFEYINRQRVKRAAALLKATSRPIIEISEAVGYNNLSFFNRYFLRIMGMSPRDFRLSSAR